MKSIILDLKNLVESKEKSYGQHMIIGIEVSDEGMPMGIVIKVKGSPIMSIGMIDLLSQKLEEARQTAYEQLEQIQNREMSQTSVREENSTRTPMDVVKDLETALDGFSHDDLPFLEDIQRRAKAAMEAMDKTALDAIIQEMKEYKKRKGGGSDESPDFNLNDFKGGF
jgi:hypothetical protein